MNMPASSGISRVQRHSVPERHHDTIGSDTHHDHMMDNTMDHSSHNMMDMTFGSLGDYKLKLLFDWWDIQEWWQYLIAWIIVCIGVVAFHGMKYLIFYIEDFTVRLKNNNDSDKTILAKSTTSKPLASPYPLFERYLPRNLVLLRVIHSFLSAVNYALSLLLMLVSMTYNPGLFIALVVGYAIGDFCFYYDRAISSSSESTAGDCH